MRSRADLISGTLRNEDLAIGRRLLLRHLITMSWQESLYLISGEGGTLNVKVMGMLVRNFFGEP